MPSTGKPNPRQLSERYSWVVLFLAAIAGSADAACYLLLGHVYTSQMSGNSIDIGVHLATAGFNDALKHLAPIGAFFAGVLLGLTADHVFAKRKISNTFRYVASMEALLLAIFFLLAHPPHFWMLVFPAVAMGLQNALLRSVGHHNVRTTFITGMLTNAAQGFVERKFGDAFFYGGIWFCFTVGGIFGALTEAAYARDALILPIAGLVVLLSVDALLPLANDSSHAKTAE